MPDRSRLIQNNDLGVVALFSVTEARALSSFAPPSHGGSAANAVSVARAYTASAHTVSRGGRHVNA